MLHATIVRGFLLVSLCSLACCHGPTPAQTQSIRTSAPTKSQKTGPIEETTRGRETTPITKLQRTPPASGEQRKQAVTELFIGRKTVRYREFVDALRSIATRLEKDPDVKRAHQRLLDEARLSASELPLESFSRVRLVFEAARSDGLWGIEYAITDRMPWSDEIWKQWKSAVDDGSFPARVEAECDEAGALVASLARDLGVVGFVGLHWPYWNHVVPVWQVDREDGGFVRIIVPATQVFLSPSATLGTRELKANRVVYAYRRKDLAASDQLPVSLARFLLARSRMYGGLATAQLDERRLTGRNRLGNERPHDD